ncbi:MAG: NAD-dependent epimerase/dehydratase family protein [Clostridia bacterium]|nr:NAD-dependent epimerase/dehydratase family protein [Clostridia bacterium]
MNTNEKIIALTGVSGAMGGEVLKSLLESDNNFKIRCILFSAEKSLPKFTKKLLKKYRKRIFKFKGDIACKEDCEKLLDGADYLIHCAALIPPKSDHDPHGTYLSNFVGTKNLIDTVIEKGNNIPFVHIATVALYGNRTYPHVWGRVGDPMISSDYDCYSMYKMKAERYLLDSGLNKFVSLRQTAVLHKYMLANNLKDGLMFHTSWNCPLEWVTDVDSGILCKHLVERDLAGKLDGFWNNIYNIGGGAECRITGFETIDEGFAVMGMNTKKVFKPNWNIPRNFHGVWFYDSDKLNDFLDFRTENNKIFWQRMGKKYWYFKVAKIVPSSLISKLAIQRLFKNTNAPKYWIKHRIDGRVKAFYGSYENFEKIGTDWKKFDLLCESKDYQNLKNIENAKPLLLDHGYDENKPLVSLTFADLAKAAAFRGGKCLSKDYNEGEIYKKIRWQCRDGHEFESAPHTILKGGYWCPHCCEPKPWRYGALADIPFFGQVYFDTHTKDEVNDVYPLSDDEDKFIENK